MVPPGSMPSDRRALSRSAASRSAVIAFASSPARSSSVAAAMTASDTEWMPMAISSVCCRRRRASSLVASRCAMPMWLCASRAARVAVAMSTPSRDAISSATSAMAGTLKRTLRTLERMVGIRSASLGAHRIQTVRGGGSSSALSRTFEVRSVIRSASSMIITR